MTTDRLALLVRFDIADSLDRLGAPRAAALVRGATTRDAWRPAHVSIVALHINDATRHERFAVQAAAFAMVFDDAVGAARVMSHLRDDEMTLDAYAAEVAAEALAAGVSL